MFGEKEFKQDYQAQSRLFKVLMHPTRLAILEILRGKEHCVCHMEAVLGLRQAHISQHLMVLRDAGLVADRRDGWNIFYRISKPEVLEVVEAATALSADKSKIHHIPDRVDQCPCPKCNPGSNCGMPVNEKEGI